jgi:serine/threonine protein kinase
MLPGLTRDSLLDHRVEVLRQEQPWKPDILLVEAKGRRAIVKDFAQRGWLYRVYGIWSTWREAYFYQKLAGLPGIPAYYGKLDRYALVIEYIPGKNASKYRPGELPHQLFDQLQTILDRVHERGVVLCDMRNDKNILVSEKFEPYVIDYGAAIEKKNGWNPIRRWLFSVFMKDDLLGLAKLKKNLAPELLSDKERQGLEKGLFLQRQAIAVRDITKRLLKKMATR